MQIESGGFVLLLMRGCGSLLLLETTADWYKLKHVGVQLAGPTITPLNYNERGPVGFSRGSHDVSEMSNSKIIFKYFKPPLEWSRAEVFCGN